MSKQRGKKGAGYWTYRLVRKDGVISIYEVHYKKKDKPWAFVDDPDCLCGESKKEIKWNLKAYKNALKRPVLKHENLLKRCEENDPPWKEEKCVWKFDGGIYQIGCCDETPVDIYDFCKYCGKKIVEEAL